MGAMGGDTAHCTLLTVATLGALQGEVRAYCVVCRVIGSWDCCPSLSACLLRLDSCVCGLWRGKGQGREGALGRGRLPFGPFCESFCPFFFHPFEDPTDLTPQMDV